MIPNLWFPLYWKDIEVIEIGNRRYTISIIDKEKARE
jgi:hypothetical protein